MNDQLYRQQIIDNYKNPQNAGQIENPDGQAKLVNTSCGDEITAYLNVENGKIKDIKFDGRGCAISIAATSIVSEEIKNMEIKELKSLEDNFVEDLIGTKLTGSRIKCGTLGLKAFQKAVDQID